jgi:hypothetical protein
MCDAVTFPKFANDLNGGMSAKINPVANQAAGVHVRR